MSEATCRANQRRRARRVPAADIHAHHAALTAALPSLPSEGCDNLVYLCETAVDRLIHRPLAADSAL